MEQMGKNKNLLSLAKQLAAARMKQGMGNMGLFFPLVIAIPCGVSWGRGAQGRVP